MAEREKGVANTPCPTCGADLNAIEQPDGGVAYETCPTCYPSQEPAPEKASRPTRRETGTAVPEPVETTGKEEN